MLGAYEGDGFMLSFTSVDYGLIAFVALCGAWGFYKGLLSEVMAIVVWFVALGLTVYFTPRVSAMLSSVVSDDAVRTYVCGGGIFILCFLLGRLPLKLMGFLSSLVAGPHILTRVLAMLLGLLKGAAIICAFVFLMNHVAKGDQLDTKSSIILKQVQQWLNKDAVKDQLSLFPNLMQEGLRPVQKIRT